MHTATVDLLLDYEVHQPSHFLFHIEAAFHDANQMVEERLKDEKCFKPRVIGKSRPRPEEVDLVINDDFYDEKFLSLVYEIESQKDDSYINN